MRLRLLLACAMLLAFVPAMGASAADVDPDEIFFPVQVTDSLQYGDSYGDARGGGRGHLGVDLMSDQMTPVYAAQPGEIFAFNDYCNDDGSYCSYYLLLQGDDGRMYFYVHLNDDTPGRPDGTCDHAGGLENAYSPRLFEAWEDGDLEGLRVERGEHLGYLGSSGNAGCKVDHLHFEIWDGTDWDTHYSDSVNPYPPTQAAQDAGNVVGPDGDASPSAAPSEQAEPAVEPDPSERIAGEDRIETAIALAQDGFTSAESVVIAPADVFAEALVGAPLAAVMDAPVLLTWSQDTEDRDALDPRVVEEIDRLGATSAVVLGSPSRLAGTLEEQLTTGTAIAAEQILRVGDDEVSTMSASVARLVLEAQGVDLPPAAEEEEDADDTTAEEPSDEPTEPSDEPSETSPDAEDDDDAAAARIVGSRAVAGQEPPTIVPFLAAGTHPQGKGWPDALAASVLGARQLAPILLTDFAVLPDDVAAILEADAIETVRITGGPEAVSPGVETAADDLGVHVHRLAGETRFETALAIAAETIEDGAVLETVALATGLNFPDALASGPVLGRTDRPLVLVHTTDEIASVTDFFRTNADAVERVQAIGGPVAISDQSLRRTATSAGHSYMR